MDHTDEKERLSALKEILKKLGYSVDNADLETKGGKIIITPHDSKSDRKEIDANELMMRSMGGLFDPETQAALIEQGYLVVHEGPRLVVTEKGKSTFGTRLDDYLEGNFSEDPTGLLLDIIRISNKKQ